MFKIRFILFSFLFLFINFSTFAAEGNGYLSHNIEAEDMRVRITDVKDCVSENVADTLCKDLTVKVLDGSLKGRVYKIKADYLDASQKNSSISVGDKYFVTYEGNDENGTPVLVLGEPDRLLGIFLLTLIFVVLVVVVSGKQGLFSIIALATNFAVLIFIIANGVFAGFNSMLLVILGGVLLLTLSMFLTYGFNKKTLSAYIGSLSGFFITIVLTLVFLPVFKMTGFSSEEASFLSDIATNIDMVDVLFVGICVGVLGLLDDITVNQSSLTFQLVSANPKLSKKQVFFKAMAVGKDHLSSMVNTLIIAYAGASFPLFLLLVRDSSSSFSSIINMEMISEEILRMLVGSIGLILTIPVSTYIATVFAKSKKLKNIDSNRDD
ncbi:MAG: YibE/F family protein [Candidatus Gracilibacteria bacterium]|jgi:uncharacterized membrane protein|nr:YibE/F family protein [Candidatus Gracilibacteria bacterium]